MTPTPVRLVEYWLFRSARMQDAYYTASRDFDRRHLWLGIPSIVFSAVVGTTVFASLSKNADVLIQLGAGVLSVSAAILTTLQTFLKYSDLSEKHRTAGVKFAHLRHSIELIQVFPPDSADELRSRLTEVEVMWDKIRQDSPTLPPRLWRSVSESLTFEQFLAQDPLAESDA